MYELVCSVVSLAYMASIATLIMPLRARLLDGLSDNLQQFWVKILLFLGALLLCGVCDFKADPASPARVSRSSSALWCPRHVLARLGPPAGDSRSSSALWCLRRNSTATQVRVPFLGALLLCGVCDEVPGHHRAGRVSRSSSALWCLRHRHRSRRGCDRGF